ncbi:hypothetical protein LGM43_36805 [Burkholderia seminalis]|uniref:cystatin domain-containing protein n=1 Tax=Burkholderia seminalis TaxID=488731 RepID=UPI001CF17234|nr:cystatin domain-containing protein [Burkholderia seminalis]MCA7955790.1 hypothetical protein [Burkholderia seminalis]
MNLADNVSAGCNAYQISIPVAHVPVDSIIAAPLIGTVQITASSAQGQPNTGGWSSVSTKDQYVKQAAIAAIVQEHNKTGHNISLLSINSAQQQVVSGENYQLSMTVMDNGIKENVTATIWSQPWLHKETLTSWQETPAKQPQLAQTIQAMASFGTAPALTAMSPGQTVISASTLLATSNH